MLKVQRVKVLAKDKDGKTLKNDKGNDKYYNNYFLFEEHNPRVRVQINIAFPKGDNAKSDFTLFNNLIDSQELGDK